MTLQEQMNMLWNEKADKLLIPFLDKRDLIVLSMSKFQTFLKKPYLLFFDFLLASQNWNSLVNSKYLFSTILNTIKEVVKENSLTITPDKNIVKKKKQMQTSGEPGRFTSSR